MNLQIALLSITITSLLLPLSFREKPKARTTNMTEETKTGDPDLLATWPNSLKVAELDNVCTVKKEFLTTGKVTIKWRHNLADKTENYYQLAATNTSQSLS